MEKVTRPADIVWANPPASNRATTLPAEVVAEFKRHPGVWGRIITGATTTAAANPWKKQGFDTRAARTNPGEKKCLYDIYVRWPQEKRPAAAAAAKGTALTPPAPRPVPRPTLPEPGSIERASREAEAFAAARAARGVGPDGKPVTSLQQR